MINVYAAKRIYTQLQTLQRDIDQTVLDLIGNPHTTANQVMEAQRKYVLERERRRQLHRIALTKGII